ncbi:uncharacterized protein LOC123712354 isoform X1 [Pieris brassicae]|uniref:uncharacterized protein LOC123712354 isoform X1 n=2 Tax=Pieris brassicae TaxID=7116 RepID=UPI001E6619C8|nr:uncharacterized protein LOC123712354 isoform X1 [Pieris brassicae]XP_045521342.1 uncharacterized protein LOC123712354 isoform X1 [Pieris brassicae]
MSSDESFLWTSASNSNSDSDDSSTSKKFSEMQEDFVKNEVDEKYKKIKNKVVNGNFIKDEHTSEVDLKIVKNEYSKGSIGNEVLFNDSYLNLRVKEEQSSCFDDSDIPVKKKKKNKKRKHSLLELNNDDRLLDVSNNEDIITTEETVNTRSCTNRDDPITATEDSNYVKHKKKKKKRRSSGEDCNNSNISEITYNNFSDPKCIDENNSISENHFESNGGNVDKLESSVRNLSKVSDRIQFEEDLDFNKSVVEANFNQKQIRRYLKNHTNLLPISPKTKLDSTITDTDDVWLVKCPQDVDIMHLKDITLGLSNKTKLKLGGKVYEYMVDQNNLRLPILTFHNQSKPVIKNLITNGCIYLKNKVPKVHIPNNEVMVNDQTNFIVLPDTKCRHPLFGIHYKKCIKVPVEIAKRLHTDQEQNSLPVQDNIKEKKKKQKIYKRSLISDEFQEPIKLEQEVSKKKKKRKLSSGTNSPVKSKRVKYDPDSTQTWDSEKAIEENLFNF